ncbi:hypothetical protein [Roseivirga sp. UBA838]|uniref:hypothetical protein n=1 Tax=Roseivirga sp. UBA838 TaxID=1947393 RepID=UPI002579952D|nr:hypothetical protein [Roseivirga sp. UBA838]|tara:strand:+ start:10136 stop:10327 length:192 start_codon:yes stop_codon:yes gene_type:complete
MEEEEKRSIYDLQLHEAQLFGHLMVQRVPGGWVYFSNDSSGLSTFVPYSGEFKEKKPFKIKQR